MSSVRSHSFASALSQGGTSFAFDDLDLPVDSPIARFPGGRRAVTIVSPNSEKLRLEGQENSWSATPAAKRSGAMTPQSILKPTPGRSTGRNTPTAARQPPSASKFRVTSTSAAAPVPESSTTAAPARSAPNTPRRRSRAPSELSEMGVTPYVDRYVAEMKSKEDERLRREEEAAAAKRAAAREAKAQHKEERREAARAAAAADASDEGSDADASPRGRQTNPMVRALRSAIAVDVATPAAWKGRANDFDAPAGRPTIEREAEELLRQPDLANEGTGRGRGATRGAKPAAKKAAPKKAASRRARSPSDDGNDFGDDGYPDTASEGSNDIMPAAPPASKAHRAQPAKHEQRPRRRLTAQGDDLEAALLDRATAPPQPATARGRSAKSAGAAARGASSKRQQSKSMEPLIIRRKSGGPAAAQGLFMLPEDPLTESDVASSDDASPLAKQRAARGRNANQQGSSRAKPQPKAAARPAARTAGKKRAPAKQPRQAEPIQPRRGARGAQSVTFADDPRRGEPVDEEEVWSDDFGDDGEAPTAPPAPYHEYDDVIDAISRDNHRRRPRQHGDATERMLANADATTAGFTGFRHGTFVPKTDLPPPSRQHARGLSASYGRTALPPPAASARSRPQSVSVAPPAGSHPLAAFMQAAFPGHVNLPPNLDALGARTKGMRLPMNATKKKRNI